VRQSDASASIPGVAGNLLNSSIFTIITSVAVVTSWRILAAC